MGWLILIVLGVIAYGSIKSTRSKTYNNKNTNYKMNRGLEKIDFNKMNDELFYQTILHNQMMEDMNQNLESLKITMEEGYKSVTPFDHGGYLMGEGFNPSDTMMENSFDEMNHMMEQDLNNMMGQDLNNMMDNNMF